MVKPPVSKDPRRRIIANENPIEVSKKIMRYSSLTSEEEQQSTTRDSRFDNLPYSPNSRFEVKNEQERLQYEEELRRVENDKTDEVVREKSKQTLTPTKNTYLEITDETDSDNGNAKNFSDIGFLGRKP